VVNVGQTSVCPAQTEVYATKPHNLSESRFYLLL